MKITNKALLEQIILSKEEGQVNDLLFQMICEMVDSLSNKKHFQSFPYLESMKAYAIDYLVSRGALKFNPAVSNNPYAYLTTCIQSAFLYYFKREKKRRKSFIIKVH